MLRILLWVVTIFMLFVGQAFLGILGKKEKPTPQLAELVTCSAEKQGEDLVIKATAKVSSAGYKASLIKASYEKQPEDGYQDFFLLVTAPEEKQERNSQELTITHTMKYSSWMTGLRVFGSAKPIVLDAKAN